MDATRAITLKHYLIHVGTGKAVPVTGTLTVGREAADLTYASDTSLSRSHFRIFLQGAQVMIEDLGASNHTFLAGAMLTARKAIPLPFGAEIIAGNQHFILSREPRLPASVRIADDRVPTAAEVFQEMQSFENWTRADLAGLGMSLVCLAWLAYRFFEPFLKHHAWPASAFNGEDFLLTCTAPVFGFFGPFFGSRRGPAIRNRSDTYKFAYAVMVPLFFAMVLAPDGTQWTAAAKHAVRKSCREDSTKDPVGCKNALLAGLLAGISIKEEKIAVYDAFVQDEEFMKKYLKKAYPEGMSRTPAATEPPPGN